MNAASRNQARAVMKSIGSLPNGSMKPYHPTLGKAFSSTPNRLGDIVDEFYTDGTTAPLTPPEGGEMFYPPLNPNDKYNTIDYSNITKADLGLGAFALESINTPAMIGLALIFVGAGFPGYKYVTKQVQKVIDKPEKYVRNTAIISGLAILVAGGGAQG